MTLMNDLRLWEVHYNAGALARSLLIELPFLIICLSTLYRQLFRQHR